ncbi:MAG TPA: rhomboid family intramembrane serine protease [Candidatus Baltobacteraceae bacterium]|nr:rhomboid family intramembrane serine protease [Candidatus Baltobacteraceae bacterium]
MSLTRLLIGINVLVFAWMLVTGGGFALLGGDVTGAFLYAHGAMRPYDVLVLGQWWRIVSSAFVHLSAVHILMNMIALNYVGAPVEWLYGKPRYALVYALALVGAGVSVVYFTEPGAFTAGASGAIFGLFGALVAAGLRLGKRGRSLITSVVPVIVLNLVFTFAVPGISAAAHLGGLLTGFIAGFVLFMIPSRPRDSAYAYAFAPAADAGRVETIEQPPDAGPHEDADAPPLEARDPRE